MKSRFFLAITAFGAVCLAGCASEPETKANDYVRSWLRQPAENGIVRFATGDTVQVSDAARDFYRTRRWRAAWTEGDDDLLERGWKLYGAIGRAHEDGLSRERYRFDVMEKLQTRLRGEGDDELPDSLKVAYLAALDVLLTEGFTRYANDLVAGTIDPHEAGVDWRIPRGEAIEERVLGAVLSGMAPSQVVARLRPSIPHYERMRGALIEYYHAAARGGWPTVPADAALKEGVRNRAVSILRTRLLLGLDPTEAALAQKGAAEPMYFDGDLKRAVEHFQERHSIEPDGAVGEGTLRELNHSVEARIDELKLNLDRWRWLPDHLGERYIIVNIAGFELDLVDKGRVIESMNVVVGQRSWQTPVFMDSVEHVVVNPYWNVPPSIYEEEILPAMERDPGYLARNDFERTGTGVRQRPGPKNALGKYKFVFPNRDDIYLHDTPAEHLFSRSRRDFSHGCIRLEKPEALARLLVRLQTNQDPSILDDLAASGRERWVKLDRPLPIYLLYFTAWVQEDGTTRFHHDVYGRDEDLQSQADKLGPVAAR